MASLNEKSKQMIELQNKQLLDDLKATFSLPVFQDNVAEDERPDTLNLFLINYGNLVGGQERGSMYQEIYVTYLAENSDTVETDSLDIISTVEGIKGKINFVNTEKDQVKKQDTDEYIDRVTFIFRRVIKYVCKV